MSVLAKIDPEYADAYKQVKERFPYAHFVEETDFRNDLQNLLDRSSAEFLSFGCDDVIFRAPILVPEIERAFKHMPDLIGISLRLGEHITENMYGQALQTPEFWWENGWLRWEMVGASGDWTYPWEVLGTIYPMAYVDEMVTAIQPTSPSQLEERGSHQWSAHTPLRRLAAWPTVRIVVPTVNMIQREFSGNGIRSTQEITPEFLLDCWNNGLRMDIDQYIKIIPPSWRIGDFYLKTV